MDSLLQQGEYTQERVKAFFKAFVWPAILVIQALKFFDKNVDG